MADERLQMPIPDDFALALGQATYAFAYAEWCVVWTCDKVRPGAVYTLTKGKTTAGGISAAFTNTVRNMPPTDLRNIFAGLAERFALIVATRNSIVHGKPATSDATGEQTLIGPAGYWTITSLREAADEFSRFSIVLSNLTAEVFPAASR